MTPGVWSILIGELDRRGERHHEAGAFLLGRCDRDLRTVEEIVFYDDLDPHAYATGVCVLHAPAFQRLWAHCRTARLTVVGDVHTHPTAAGQSEADRTNPMVAREGHIAIIVPDFAKAPPAKDRLGLFEYRGDHRWTDHSGRRAKRFLHIDIWSHLL
jgi:proteasome lid subunit RPN8/RPN11